VTDPSTRARLSALQERLTRPSPAPLDGQQAIALDEDLDGPDGTPTRPSQPSQPTLW